MAQIFGDTTDDITFGNAPSRSKPILVSEKVRNPRPLPSQNNSGTPAAPVRSAPHPSEQRNTKPRAFSMPEPTSLSSSLSTLIESMKPTYLPNFSDGIIRLVALSDPTHDDPFLLLRSDDVSLIFGTGFSSVENA